MSECTETKNELLVDKKKEIEDEVNEILSARTEEEIKRVSLKLVLHVFSLYFTNFSNYSYMYGSLTAIVLLMLWLYFCICILFIGAEINHFLYEDD